MDAYSQIIIDSVAKVKNAVVKIDVFKNVKGKMQRTGSGSGFIFSSDGLIFTNHHVVNGAEKIMVSLLNENEIEATLIGKDPDADLAILKIYSEGYSVSKHDHAARSIRKRIHRLPQEARSICESNVSCRLGGRE